MKGVNVSVRRIKCQFFKSNMPSIPLHRATARENDWDEEVSAYNFINCSFA